MEYVAPQSYCARPPMEPWHAFVIDMTVGALRSGAAAAVCSAVRAAVEALAAEPRARVAVMTYDDRIQFYSVAGGTPRMMVVSDIQVWVGQYRRRLFMRARLIFAGRVRSLVSTAVGPTWTSMSLGFIESMHHTVS